MTHWKRPWCWERLKAKREGGGRGWDGWMASLTQWTWIWANSGRQWRTEEPGVLQSMGSQRVRHDLATEQRQQQRGRVECPRVCLLNICTLRGSLLSAQHYWVFDEQSPFWAGVWNPFLITVFSKPPRTLVCGGAHLAGSWWGLPKVSCWALCVYSRNKPVCIRIRYCSSLYFAEDVEAQKESVAF